MTRFAEYRRVSTSPQERKMGAAKQERVNAEYVAHIGGKIVATYTDSITGTTATRDGLDKLLQDARKRLFTAVVVNDIKRVGRKALVNYQIEDEITRAGLRLHISSQYKEYDFSKAEDKLIYGFETLIAEADHSYTVQRLYDDRLSAAHRGKLPAGIRMYGYRRKWMEDGTRVWELYPEQAQWVRQMFVWAEQGLGMYAIADRLNSMGVPQARCTTGWAGATVNNILSNDAYMGTLTHTFKRPKEPITLSFPIPAIITPEQFATVNQARSTRRAGGPQYTRSGEFPLVGMCFCGVCGWRLQFDGYNSKKTTGSYQMYRCKNRTCAHRKGHYRDQIDALALEILSSARTSPKKLLGMLAPTPTPAEANNAQIEALRKREGRVLEGYEQGLYSLDESKTRLAAIRQEIGKLREPPMSAPVADVSKRLADLGQGNDLFAFRRCGIFLVIYPDMSVKVRFGSPVL